MKYLTQDDNGVAGMGIQGQTWADTTLVRLIMHLVVLLHIKRWAQDVFCTQKGYHPYWVLHDTPRMHIKIQIVSLHPDVEFCVTKILEVTLWWTSCSIRFITCAAPSRSYVVLLVTCVTVRVMVRIGAHLYNFWPYMVTNRNWCVG